MRINTDNGLRHKITLLQEAHCAFKWNVFHESTLYCSNLSKDHHDSVTHSKLVFHRFKSWNIAACSHITHSLCCGFTRYTNTVKLCTRLYHSTAAFCIYTHTYIMPETDRQNTTIASNLIMTTSQEPRQKYFLYVRCVTWTWTVAESLSFLEISHVRFMGNLRDVKW